MKGTDTLAILIFSLVPNLHFGQGLDVAGDAGMALLKDFKSISLENNYVRSFRKYSAAAANNKVTLDMAPPVFLDVPEDSTIVCRQMSSTPAIHAEDLSGPVAISFSQMIDSDGPGTFVLTRKWVATDLFGNSAEAVQHITWVPESTLECDMVLPQSIECDSHRLTMSSNVKGGFGPYSYVWQVTGSHSAIEEGQGTPEISINLGGEEANITLMVTDAYGCVSICETRMECPVSNTKTNDPSKVISNSSGNSKAKANVRSSYPALHSGQCLKQFQLQYKPVNGYLNISFETTIDGNVEYKLSNFLGNEVLDNQFECHKGFNAFKIDVERYPAGRYEMQIKSERELLTKSVVLGPTN